METMNTTTESTATDDATITPTSPPPPPSTTTTTTSSKNRIMTSHLPPPPRAADLQFGVEDSTKRLYWDRSHYDSPQKQMEALTKSSTLYVGNLSFSVRTSQIRSHFSQLGRVKTIHLGLDRLKKSPCGFCFVEYYSRQDALAAVSLLSSTMLDGNVIRVELDSGFKPGRQYGRGRHGGQVRDDVRRAAQKRQRPEPETTTAAAAAVSTGEFNNTTESDNYEPDAKRRRF